MQLSVPNMSCGHCTSTIEKALKGADADAAVSFDLGNHTVSVKTNLPSGDIVAVIQAAGYKSDIIAD